jgi:hypothetical protein
VSFDVLSENNKFEIRKHSISAFVSGKIVFSIMNMLKVAV